jgi:hypothetical protein
LTAGFRVVAHLVLVVAVVAVTASIGIPTGRHSTAIP